MRFRVPSAEWVIGATEAMTLASQRCCPSVPLSFYTAPGYTPYSLFLAWFFIYFTYVRTHRGQVQVERTSLFLTRPKPLLNDSQECGLFLNVKGLTIMPKHPISVSLSHQSLAATRLVMLAPTRHTHHEFNWEFKSRRSFHLIIPTYLSEKKSFLSLYKRKKTQAEIHERLHPDWQKYLIRLKENTISLDDDWWKRKDDDDRKRREEDDRKRREDQRRKEEEDRRRREEEDRRRREDDRRRREDDDRRRREDAQRPW